MKLKVVVLLLIVFIFSSCDKSNDGSTILNDESSEINQVINDADNKIVIAIADIPSARKSDET